MSRVETVVFRVEDDEKFKVIWDFLKSNTKPMTWAAGNKIDELERIIAIFLYFTAEIDNYDYFELADSLAVKHQWMGYEDWEPYRVIEEIAKVWQPPEEY